jgi:spermidine synthase
MRNLLLVAAFFEGFYLLVLELFYIQLLKPFYGDSYFVWLTMIAVTMTGSGIGYFLGGAICKKDDASVRTIIFVILSSISILIAIIYPLNEFLFVKLAETDLVIGLVIHSVFILLLPVSLVTLFNPIIINYISNVYKSGKASGLVFFVSTTGGITGVYLLAFLLFPGMDLLFILKIIFILFTLCVSAYLLLSQRYRPVLFHVFFSLVLFVSFLNNVREPKRGKDTKIVYRNHGIMGEIEIMDKGENIRYMNINGTTQSAINPKTEQSIWTYPYRVSAYASAFPEGSDVLVAGLGGGVLVNQLIWVKFNVTCIEFDKRQYDVAKRYMSLRDDFHFEADDFRHYINVTDKKYDIIILDLSKGESIPSHVYTLESFNKMSELLKEDGIIMLHYFSNIYGKGDIGLKSILKTFEETGLHFALIRKKECDNSSEEIIVASKNKQLIDEKKIRVPKPSLKKIGFADTDIFVKQYDYSEGIVLRDDKNQMEKIQFEAVKDIRNRVRKTEIKSFYGQ